MVLETIHIENLLKHICLDGPRLFAVAVVVVTPYTRSYYFLETHASLSLTLHTTAIFQLRTKIERHFSRFKRCYIQFNQTSRVYFSRFLNKSQYFLLNGKAIQFIFMVYCVKKMKPAFMIGKECVNCAYAKQKFIFSGVIFLSFNNVHFLRFVIFD